MSLEWADFPSGQPGLYGTDENFMLDGTPWVAYSNGSIVPDPDAVNFPNGLVLRHGAGSSGANDAPRLALMNPNQRAFLAVRLNLTALPTDARPLYAFNSGGNAPHYVIGVMPNGGMRWTLANTQTVIAEVETPLLLAGSDHHLEIMVDVVTGDLEVRKNGIVIAGLTLVHGAPPGGTVGLIAFPSGYAAQGSFTRIHSKDIVVYTAAGTEFNDFQGTVGVNDLLPVADVTLGDWTLSGGATAWSLLDESPPDDADYVQSGLAPTNPLQVELEDLPIDVTSVRGIIMIGRAFNSDVGDGSIQMGVTSNGGTNFDLGAAHAATVAPTFYFDPSELSPVTAAAWTPTEINNLWLQLDRAV